MFERYSFVAVTSADLVRAKAFWSGLLGCKLTEDRPGQFFIVDVGGLRMCVDAEDGRTHVAGSTDPSVGIKVASVRDTLAALKQRGLSQAVQIVQGGRGAYAIVHDPDGRSVIFTETD